MSDSTLDAAIVGGGLAGGLIALALHQARPEFRITLIEGGPVIGGNHRWSWFESDLSPEGQALLEPFRRTVWEDGYDVRFPKLKRTLQTGYHSMASSDFHEGLMRLLPDGAIMLGKRAASLDGRGVDLEDGKRLDARMVVDCRNFQPSEHLRGGWQVFMGRHMRLEEPHQVSRPVIMDGDVDQLAPYGNGGAYRFVYVLPLGAHDVFVEDTYYADDAKLDRGALSGRIDQYCHAQGWSNGVPVSHEAGLLPVLTGGDFAAYQAEVRIPGVSVVGTRGGFTHPLTSYTLPIAVDNALAMAREADLSGAQMAALFEARARKHWRKTAYYRMLNRMLFFAADPHKRVDVLQRFYGLSQNLIERFYAARSPLHDQARVLWGKPPVSIPRAIKAIFMRGAPLKAERSGNVSAPAETTLKTEKTA